MTVTHTDESVLELLDFDYAPPCEHTSHTGDEPAMFLVTRLKPCCVPSNYYCCLPCWELMGRVDSLTCSRCKRHVGTRDQILKIVRVIGT